MKKHLIIFGILIVFLTSCAPKSHTETYFAMDTVMTITAYGSTAKTAVKDAFAEVTRLEKLLSVTDSNSEIYALNHRKTTKVSKETAELIKTALKLSKETNGAFDVTLYPVSKLWGFTEGAFSVPSALEIKSALSSTGYDKISVSDCEVSLPEGFMIDLGGIAKGHAAEKIKEIMKKNNVESAIISLGGNVQAIGCKPKNSDWKVGIADPFGGESEETVSVRSSAVVTSGGYQRNFTENGTTYHHILDPQTGYPAENGIASVTVICENGTAADALSTAFFVMGEEKAREFCQNHDGISAVIILQNGDVVNVE